MDALFEEFQQQPVHQLDVPPKLRQFFGELSASGHLDAFLASMIKAGLAKDLESAVQRLASVSEQIDLGEITIAHADFSSGAFLRPIMRFIQSVSDDQERVQDPNLSYRLQGTAGHAAIAQLLAGSVRRKKPLPAYQVPLFGEHERLPSAAANEQPRLIELPDDIPPFEGTLFENWPGDNHLADLSSCWQAITASQEAVEAWYDKFIATEEGLPELSRLLTPYFGPYVWRVRVHRDALSRYLSGFTLMSWASVLLYLCQAEPRPMFCEVPVLPSGAGFSGGRIDAIEVAKIKGRKPRPHQIRLIAEMAKHRFGSVGELKVELAKLFGNDIELAFFDWKFAVGDATNPLQILTPADVRVAPVEHRDQMKRYLTLGSVSTHLVGGRPESEWWTSSQGGRGTLVYFMPNVLAVPRRISMDPDEQRVHFQSHIASKWTLVTERAKMRHLSRGVTKTLKGILTANGETSAPRQVPPSETTALVERLPSPLTIREIVTASKQFADNLHILEVIGNKQDGRPQLFLHVDTLLEAVENGDVLVSQSQLPEFITVSCLMPNHDDSTPSMRVDVRKGFFHCYGCAASGRILPSSLPDEWELPEIGFRKRQQKRRDLTYQIPDRTAEILGWTQQLLAAAFRGSPAEDYLWQVRCIPPDLASVYGVGYADDRLFHGLIDLGVSLDEMAENGLVGYSARVTSRGSLVRLLHSRGLRVMDCKIPIKLGRGRETFGFCYSTLGGRATFPLTFAGKNTNFYGRSISGTDKRFFHRKLKHRPGIPQGGFNMEALDRGVEVGMVEGAIDGLTRIAMGFPATVGIIGVNNHLIIEEVARRAPSIGIGLDVDETGGRATYNQIMQHLAKVDYRGGIRDITAEFICETYGAGRCKDWNKWWQKYGHHGHY